MLCCPGYKDRAEPAPIGCPGNQPLLRAIPVRPTGRVTPIRQAQPVALRNPGAPSGKVGVPTPLGSCGRW